MTYHHQQECGFPSLPLAQWWTDYLSLRPKPDFFNLRLRLQPPNFMIENPSLLTCVKTIQNLAYGVVLDCFHICVIGLDFSNHHFWIHWITTMLLTYLWLSFKDKANWSLVHEILSMHAKAVTIIILWLKCKFLSC